MGFTDQVLDVLRGRAAEDIVTRYRKVAQPTRASTLPRSPKVDEEAVVLLDAANGVCGRFIYLPDTSPYPWKHIGGPPLSSFLATLETTASATFTDLATQGPNITFPFAGEYSVALSAGMFHTAAGIQLMGFAFNGAAPASDTGSARATGPNQGQGYAENVYTLVTPGQVNRAMYRTTGGATASFFDRWISATPIRVAG